MTRFLKRILWTLILLTTICSSAALASGKGVVLNFNEVDISTMVKFISDLTGKNFILDERVKGKISVYSPSKLSTDEAYNVFVSVLELKGFTVVPSGKVAKIVPSAGARQSGFTLLPAGDALPVNESYIAQVTKLVNISAQEALTFLQPMISKDGHISVFGPANLILMVDSSLNIRKLQGLLQTIDSERNREGLEIIYLKNSSAENAAATIRQWLTGADSKTAGQTAAAGAGIGGSVLADQRLNALLVFGNESTKKAVRELLVKLDVPPPEASSKVNVYYLENTDATEMAKVLEGVVKGLTTTTPGQPTAVSPLESGKVTITADKASNSLVIMASLNDYNNLLQVIKKLDRRSKQVFVQVLIAEVSLDKSRNIGVQGGVVAAGVLSKYLQGGGLYDPFGTFDKIINSSAAASLGISSLTTSPKPVTGVAMIQALDSSGLINILSTPNILTSDNKEAEIFVGENVPFKGSISYTGTSNLNPQQSIERKDTGINLKIKPQISEGEYIRLDISQEISAVKDTTAAGAVDLITTKRSAKTSVVVKDKETVVIGGLIQDNETESIDKVPFFGDIPGLGWLFKTKSKKRSKTNLMILLIPHIVKDAADMNAVSESQRTKFGEAVKKIEPIDVQKEISGK